MGVLMMTDFILAACTAITSSIAIYRRGWTLPAVACLIGGTSAIGMGLYVLVGNLAVSSRFQLVSPLLMLELWMLPTVFALSGILQGMIEMNDIKHRR